MAIFLMQTNKKARFDVPLLIVVQLTGYPSHFILLPTTLFVILSFIVRWIAWCVVANRDFEGIF